MSTNMHVRPALRGGVIGLGLGRFVFAGRGVGLRVTAAILATLGGVGGLSATAMAGPEGAKVVAGEASINQQGNRTVIRAGDRTIIDYTRFNVGSNEFVRFIQPNATARVLNRISGAEPTRIDGVVRANGIVYFVNPSGVMFGQGAVINTNGLYAAGANLSNTDFLNGVNRFTNVVGDVVNQGTINSPQAALIGQHVLNSGVIDTGGASGGIVTMVAGDEVVLSKNGETMSVRVSPDNAALRDASQAGVENSGSVRARNGRARIVAGDMYSLAIKDTGNITARDVKIQGKGSGLVQVGGKIDASNQVNGDQGGRVEITGQNVALTGAQIDATGSAGGGQVYVGGQRHGEGAVRNATTTYMSSDSHIDASATERGGGGEVIVWSDTHSAVYGTIAARGGARGGNGGFVETSGKQTLDLRGASVDASAARGSSGTWLLDPYNVTITAAGGGVDDISGNNYTPTGDNAQVSAQSISSALSGGPNGTNVIITTGLSGSAGTQSGHLVVNAPIQKNSSNTATLTLEAAGDLTVAQPITSIGGGRLNVNLLAESLAMSIDAAISTNGGTFTSSSAAATAINATIDTRGSGSDGAVSITASDVDFGLVTGNIAAGTANIALIPTTAVTNVNVNAGSSGFAISAADLARLGTTGFVSIGRLAGTQTVTMNSTALDLSATPSVYSLELLGDTVTLNNTLTMGGGKTFTATTSGDITIGGAINFAAGNASNSVSFSSDTGNVIINQGISTLGGTFFSAGDNFTQNASVQTLGGGIGIFHTGTIAINNALNASGGSGTGQIDLSGADVAINTGTGSVFGGTGGVNFIPVSGVTTLSVGAGSGANTFEITNAELARVSVASGGTIRFGQSGGTYAVNIGTLNTTAVAGQNGANYAFAGGAMTFSGNVLVRNNARVTLNASSISGDPLMNNIGFNGLGGTLAITTTGNATLGTNARVLDQSNIGGNLDIGFTNDVIQSDSIFVGGSSTIRSFNDAGAGITFDDAGNIFTGPVTIRTLNAAGTTVVAGDITLASSTDLTVTQAQSTSDVSISSGGNLNAVSVSAGPTAVLNATGNLTTGAVSALRVDATAGGVANINGAMSGTNGVVVTAQDVAINTSTGSISASAGDVNILPATLSDEISIEDAPVMGLNLSTAELLRISTPGQVIIGNVGQTGDLHIGGQGPVDLTAVGYDLTLRAGDIMFSGGVPRGAPPGGITLADDAQLSLISTGAILGRGLGTPDVTIGGNAGAVLAIASNGISLWSSAAQIAGRTSTNNIHWTSTGGPGLTVTQLSYTDTLGVATASADGLVVGTGRMVQLECGTTLSLARAIVAPGGFVDIASTGTIFVPGTTASRVTANRLRINVTNGSIGGGSTLYTTLGGSGVNGQLDATAPFGIDINNGFGLMTQLNLDPVSLYSSAGLVKLVNTGTIVQASGAAWVGNGFDVRSSGNFIWLKEGVASTADARFESPRVIILSAGKTIDTGASDLTLVAGDLALEGSITAANTHIAGSTAASRTIGLGTATGDMTIDNDELSRITTSTLTIDGDTVTRITVSGVDLTGNTAPTRVVLGAGDPTGQIFFSTTASSFKALDALANNGVMINTNLTTTGAELFVNGDFDNAAAPTLADDAIHIAAGLTLRAKTGLTLRSTTGGTIADGNVTLLGDEGVTISGNFTNALGSTTVNADNDANGSGTFTYQNGTMTLGNSTTARNLQVTAADVDLQGTIAALAGQLIFGRSTSGEIWLGDVTGAPGSALKLDETELSHISAADVAFGGTNTTLINVSGLRNNVLNGLDSSRMTVTHSISLTSDDINVTSNALLAEQADLIISRGTAGSVGVGTATGDMTIDLNELNRISGKSLTIKNINTASATDNETRDVRVRDVSAGDVSLIAGTFAVEAGNTITLTDTTTGDAAKFRFNGFSATANNGVDVNASITTTAGDLILNGDLDNTAQGNDKVTIRLNRSLTSGRDLVIDGDGGATAEGGLVMTAARNVSLQTNLTTQGATEVHADSDNSGNGAFIVGVGSRLNTSSNNLTITAADIDLGGDTSPVNAISLLTGGGVISIDRTTLGTVNLGAFTNAQGAASSDPMIITNAELGRILSSGLTIGGANTNLMRVEGVTPGASDRIAGVTTLQALGTGGNINFDSTASTFNTLKAVADSAITVNRSITADTGGIELDGGGNTAFFGDGLVTLNADLAGTTSGDSAVRSTLVLGATTVNVTGENVTFNGTINSDSVAARALVVNSAATGDTAFLGDVGVTRRLASLTTNEGGKDTVAGSILAQQSINLGGDVEMTGASPTLETTGGTGIRMGGVSKIKGTITAAGATGNIRFADRVTATDTVNISTLGGGDVIFRKEARLQGTISANGTDANVNFGGPVGLNGNLSVTSADSGIIAFKKNIFSTGGAHDLTVQVAHPNDNPAAATPSAPNPLPPTIPTVRFGGAIGQMTNGDAAALHNLTINGAGRTVVPRQATIVGTTTAGINANLTGDFRVGQNEKITSLGGVRISANKITVGDISARNDIALTASSSGADAITILNRPKQQLLAVRFNPDASASAQTLTLLPMDDGLDIVSAFGLVTFNRLPQVVGTGPRPRLASATGELGGDQNNYNGFLTRQFQNASDPGAVPESRFSQIASNAGRFLDLTASGPSTTNFASGVAQAIPRDNRVNVVGQENVIDPATKDALSDMALNPREPNVKELLDLLVGAATFDDTPGKVGPAQASDYRVVLNRLPYKPTRALADSYLELFGERAVRTERLASIRGAFAESAKHFREQNKIKTKTLDPGAFRAFLEQNDAEHTTLEYAQKLSAFFERLSALGLTIGEENRVRGGLLRQIQPSGQFSSIREFEKVFVNESVSVK